VPNFLKSEKQQILQRLFPIDFPLHLIGHALASHESLEERNVFNVVHCYSKTAIVQVMMKGKIDIA
jgi:hypothetical protein